MERKEIDIFDIMLSLVRHKLLIIIITFLVSAGAVIYVLVVPEKWSATTTFKTVTDDGGASSIGASLLGMGASFLGGSSTSSIDHLITLNSRHFRDTIIKKFNLVEYFEIKEEDELLRNDIAYELFVNEVIATSINNESQLIAITALTKDRDLSVEIANYCREYLEEYTKKSKMI